MKKIISFLLVIVMTLTCIGCVPASTEQISTQSDATKFETERRISVINTRTDNPIFTMTGYFALSDIKSDALTITSKTGPDEYRVNYLHLNDDTIYFVEDITGAHVSKYRYEVYFYPDPIVSILLPFHE